LTAIKNGETIFVLIDVMVGVLPLDDSKNVVPIRLLKSKVKMRSGILSLAYRSKYPLVQVVGCWNENSVRHLEFRTVDYENLTYEVLLQKIWDGFAEKLERHPSQWESYHTFYKFISPELAHVRNLPGLSNERYRFDEGNLKIFKERDGTYIGSYATSAIFSASKKVVKVIDFCLKENVQFTIAELLELFEEEEIVSRMIVHKIIVQA